ncbi:MAG: MFS transporter [Halodesulfurarchaeum sp.]
MRRPSLDAIRGFDRVVYAVALGQLINVFGSGIVYPFATVHFHLEVGIALSVVGLGFLAKNVTTAVATSIGGFLSDRQGRKPVMLASMAGNALTLSAFAFVPDLARAVGVLTPGSAFVLVAAASGLTAGLYTPAAQAYTADATGDTSRDQAFSLLKVANNVGFGTGFVVGGLLYQVANVAIFIADGATSGLVAILLLFFVPKRFDRNEESAGRSTLATWRGAITDRRVLHLALLNLGFAVLYAQMRTTIPVVAEERVGLDSAQLGTLFVLNPLTLVLLQIPVVDAISAWRRTRGLVLSATFWALSMVAVWLVYLSAPAFLLGVLLVGGHLVLRTVGEVLHSPLVTSLMSTLGTVEERGSQLSVLEVAKRLGFGVGSFVGGLFFDYGVSNLLWPTLGLLALALLVGVLALERHLTPAENGALTAGA